MANKRKVMDQLVIEDAKLIFKNFSGKEGKYNPAGRRNFCVLLDDEISKQLEKDGWNIRYLPAREEGEPDAPYLQVSVSFDKYPPRCVLISNGNKTLLTEEDVSLIDFADIENVDIMLNPYNWEVSNKRGVKAYLKSIYVTLKDDALEAKYYQVATSAKSAIVEEVDD